MFPEEEIRERTFAEARHYGLLAGRLFGEPFVQKEVGLVDDQRRRQRQVFARTLGRKLVVCVRELIARADFTTEAQGH